MTVIYVPRKEPHTEEVTKMSRLIEICNQFNPMEQKRFKRFVFCDMNKEEENMIINHLRTSLLIPQDQRMDIGKTIYIAEIGTIELQ